VAHRSARRLLALGLLLLASLVVLVAGAIATGHAAIVGTHGVSMHPVYHQGDLVVVAKSGSYEVGQIVAYHLPDRHIVVVHRIIGGDATGFVMKGDNNQSIDPTRPAASQLIGRAVLHLRHGGLWLARLTSPLSLGLIAFGLTASGGTAIQTRRRRKRVAMSRHADRSPHPTWSLFDLTPQLRTATAVAAALAIAGLALGALAWTASPDKPATTSTQVTRTMSFSYAAAVPRTPAYDETTARSPDPVFRRLTNVIDLHLGYQGSPGSVSVSAELSTPGGWHSNVRLAAPVSFTESRWESSVRLDLNVFDARARSAAAVTGLPAIPLTVTVLPNIQTAGDSAFMPTLKLNLTPLQLSLAGDPTSLTVQDSTTRSHPANIPRTLGLPGRHLTVIQARALSAILLLAALLAAAALAFVVRHTPQASEGTRIRRRYAPLLASVHPITTPTDRPVIEVAEFATLAKLAERCGQLILHWSRSNTATFIVLDEGTTYRYRTGSGPDPGAHGTAPGPRTDANHRHNPELEWI
jgi:signal peptidase I